MRSLNEFLSDEMDRDWMDHAACAVIDPYTADRLFFQDGKKDPHQIARKWICGRCPVQLECLEYGNEVAPEFGAWGGVGQAQRRLDRRYHGETRDNLKEEMIDAER